jgi:RNA polymerase sigma-70 factor (ECF subfamily)
MRGMKWNTCSPQRSTPSQTCRAFSLGRNGVLIIMNASLRVRTRTYLPLESRNGEPRLMDIEKQPAVAGSPLSGPGARREGSRSAWPDAWLINAVRREPPDEASLDVLVTRYWKTLFARCQILTLDRDAASDLAQEAWLRVLRARSTLEPDGNFHAYIITVATNLWRDRNRTARRAGAMADSRLESLDAVDPDRGQPMALVDMVPDANTLSMDEQVLLKMDIDDALQRLSPHLRDVLVSRFITGESAAEIGRRYERTEQTISSWIREAVREMKAYLGESRYSDARVDTR